MERKTVVVVDDEEDMASFLEKVLRENGYRVFTARNGRDGIETILRVRPDVALLDVLMPVVQGADACLYLKSQLERMKIVMVTSLPRRQFDLLGGGQSGPDAYLTKPVGAREVVGTVEKLLAEKADEAREEEP